MISIFGRDYDINVTSITLRWKYVSEIPKEIQYLTQLSRLDLYGNIIQMIPKEIQYLTQLTYLNLGDKII